jgi:hypothetical protein
MDRRPLGDVPDCRYPIGHEQATVIAGDDEGSTSAAGTIGADLIDGPKRAPASEGQIRQGHIGEGQTGQGLTRQGQTSQGHSIRTVRCG